MPQDQIDAALALGVVVKPQAGDRFELLFQGLILIAESAPEALDLVQFLAE